MIYTDTIHLISDSSVDELHRFAVGIGLRHEWFQDHPLRPHYDLMKNKKKKAVEAGAKKVSSREIVEILRSSPYIHERAKEVKGFHYISRKNIIHRKHIKSMDLAACKQDLGIMKHEQYPNLINYSLCVTCLKLMK